MRAKFNLIALAGLIACLLLAAPGWAKPSFHICLVAKVVDGDTLEVACVDTARTRVRLALINTPELADARGRWPLQPGATQATDALKREADGRWVWLKVVALDDYGRMLAEVWRHGDGMSLGLLMAEAGWAQVRCNKRCPEVRAAKERAKAAGRGIWGLSDPGARVWDSDWRKGKRE